MSIILNIKRCFVNFYLLYPSLAILSIIIDTFILFQNLSVITDRLNPYQYPFPALNSLFTNPATDSSQATTA